MKFSPIIAALLILTAVICFTPQPTDASSSALCSCSGYSEPTVARKTPARDFIAKQPVRKTLSVLKAKAKGCSGN